MGKRGAIRHIERRAHEFFRSFSVAQSKYWSKIAEINPQRRITAVSTGRFDLDSAGVRPSSFQSFDIGYTSHSHDIWRLTVAVGNVGVRSSELICLESVSEK